jgi:hypothetical protein
MVTSTFQIYTLQTSIRLDSSKYVINLKLQSLTSRSHFPNLFEGNWVWEVNALELGTSTFRPHEPPTCNLLVDQLRRRTVTKLLRIEYEIIYTTVYDVVVVLRHFEVFPLLSLTKSQMFHSGARNRSSSPRSRWKHHGGRSEEALGSRQQA